MPLPIVTGREYAEQAYEYRNSGIPYSSLDCVHFVNRVRMDLDLPSMLNGTNTLWRSNNLTWKGTLAQAYAAWGVNNWKQLPKGILLFRIKSESDPDYDHPPIPAKYYMDGVGNVTHVGIMTGMGMGVMQSGGYGGSGVHESGWRNGYWTHCALQMNVEYPPSGPTPDDPDDPDPPDPDDPDPYTPDDHVDILPSFMGVMRTKKKELKPRCLRI